MMKTEMEKEIGKEMRTGMEKDGESGLKGLRELFREEDGMGTVEVILIIVVLVGLVVIFKNQITGIVNKLFQKISNQATGI